MKAATKTAKSGRAQPKARPKKPAKAAVEAAKPRDIARIFMHGRSQAVRLPKEFRLPGDRVRLRREGQNLVLQPLEFDLAAWWAEVDRAGGGAPFMPQGREQPPMPPDDPLDSWD
ncbi:MAG TPA: AbrB/MazE/SpoVT family DNA-binding domain-containing protein [Terriglobales bacterium]|nr:AbrB/MazE/SpoVT family DNA-binding domain-containing protein [Terriglobales bacterium]